MSNRVKRKGRESKGSNQKNVSWKDFLGELGRRLAFHEQRVRELRPLIADLQRAKADGVVFPVQGQQGA